MNVIVFGASGMIGQGVLRECLLDPQVERVLVIGRSSTGTQHPKLRESIHKDLLNLAPIEQELVGYDACYFCLGISSYKLTEDEYRRITYDITLAVAETLARLNPQLCFIYVSGAGTDSTEQGKTMWARVKGKTENDLLRLPFRAAYMFRFGLVQPVHGARSKTQLYHLLYLLMSPLLPLIRLAFPNQVFTTAELGRAMLLVTRNGYAKPVLETRDIRALLNIPKQ